MKYLKYIFVFLILLISLKIFSQKVDEVETNDTILIYAEQMPEYPGGINGIIRQVAMNVDYPKEAREKFIDGTVFLRFEVTKTGDIGKIEIQKSVHPLLDNAAINAVKTLEKFKPAVHKGKNVNVWMSIPVKFNIQGPKTTMPVFKDENGLSITEYISLLIYEIEQHRDPDIYGTVDLNVEITKKGKVAKIEKLKGIEADFDKQVIQKIKLLPDFIPATKNGKPVKCFVEIPIIFPEKTYDIRKYPEFKNLSLSFDEYISKNINYPKEALYAGLNGFVSIKFELTKEGEIKEINLINSSNPIFEEEALRLIKTLPELKPELIHNKPANVRIPVSIKFNCDTFDIIEPEYSGDYEELAEIYKDSINKYINEKEIPEKYYLFLEINKDGKIGKQKICYGKKDKKNIKIDSIVNKITATLPDFIPGKINGKPADTWYIIPVFGNTIFIYVKNMPEFPGGVVALKRFIAEHINYPKVARENGIDGTVFLRFEVTKTGNIGKVEIQKGVHPLLDNEAIRVIKSLPKFKPGEQKNGKKVSVWYSIPVTFKLN